MIKTSAIQPASYFNKIRTINAKYSNMNLIQLI